MSLPSSACSPVRRRMAGDHLVKAAEELFGFCFGLALQALRHHRGGRFRNGAAGALEADVANRVAFEIEIDGEAVAAERIESLGLVIGAGELAEIARSLAVLEDHVLIEIAQVGH